VFNASKKIRGLHQRLDFNFVGGKGTKENEAGFERTHEIKKASKEGLTRAGHKRLKGTQ